MTAMEMQAEVLSALAILVPLMAFIYSLHRDQRRRFEALEQRMDQTVRRASSNEWTNGSTGHGSTGASLTESSQRGYRRNGRSSW